MTRAFAAIGLDADDTLWHNEDAFHATEKAFVDLVRPYTTAGDDAAIAKALLDTETRNLDLFGYGVKSFTLSMVECALELTNDRLPSSAVAELIERGKAILSRPPELLPGVVDALEELASDHDLLLITKGDLHHQERRIRESGLSHHFLAHHIVAEKNVDSYRAVLARHGVMPAEFVMVGNSVRSDLLPVIELGGVGVHIPYHVTWAHEEASSQHITRNEDGASYWELSSFSELPALLERLARRGPSPSAGR